MALKNEVKALMRLFLNSNSDIVTIFKEMYKTNVKKA
jgi:hypothetical protein